MFGLSNPKLELPKLKTLPSDVSVVKEQEGLWRMYWKGTTGIDSVVIHADNKEQAEKKARLYYRRALVLGLVGNPITIHITKPKYDIKKLLAKIPKIGCPKCGSPQYTPEEITVEGRKKRIWYCHSCGHYWRRKKYVIKTEEKQEPKEITKVLLGKDYKEYDITGPPIKGLQLSDIKIYATRESDVTKFQQQLAKWLGYGKTKYIAPVIVKRTPTEYRMR